MSDCASRGPRCSIRFGGKPAFRFDPPGILKAGSREYVIPNWLLQFYVYQRPDGCWIVIDRGWDIAVGRPYKRKAAAINAAEKAHREWLQKVARRAAERLNERQAEAGVR